jgi:DNA polymerase I-like protein with 3'-5' exonuclease and polymerase domains
MIILNSSNPPPNDPASLELLYNGLDCCITTEVFREVQGLRTSTSDLIYNFERGLLAPALEMMRRGFKIDESARQDGLKDIRKRVTKLESNLNLMAEAIWDKPVNPRSRQQLLDLFHNHMAIPKVYSNKRGVRSIAMDRDALEKISLYFHARPFVESIMTIRDLGKQAEVFKTKISNGRFYFSFNVAGTETGRWSSSKSAFGVGRNIQNIDSSLRYIFVADPGYKLCQIDLKQAESRECGFILGTLFDDWKYLDACESGDVHTGVCKLLWKDLPWTGNLEKDIKVAEQPFYRHFTYRFMSKRCGHASNYYGKPPTIAKTIKAPTEIVQEFQDSYFSEFPSFTKWHTWTAGRLQTERRLLNLFGRERHFFGRENDDTTLREAIAYNPQSSTADRTNLGLWRVWKHMRGRIQLLVQGHDAIVFQYRVEDGEAEIIRDALNHMEVWLKHKDREFVVPGDAKVGWNWGDFDEESNPNGLKEWTGSDDRSWLSRFEQPIR